MFIEVAILNIRHFSCTLYVLTHFTLVTFFLSLRKCCLVTRFTAYLSKEIQGMRCFRVYVKTPFTNLSIFFPGDCRSTEDTK